MIAWKAREEGFSRRRQDLPSERSSKIGTAVRGMLATLVSVIFVFR